MQFDSAELAVGFAVPVVRIALTLKKRNLLIANGIAYNRPGYSRFHSQQSFQLRRNMPIRTHLSLTILIALFLTTTFTFAQDADFQTGKIVAIQKTSSGSGISTAGTDAPTVQNRQRYKVSIQLNDTVYVCRADTTEDMDLEWAQGKEAPVRVKGKTLELKRANGKMVRLSILSTQKAR